VVRLFGVFRATVADLVSVHHMRERAIYEVDGKAWRNWDYTTAQPDNRVSGG
jgi:hypothetical protein